MITVHHRNRSIELPGEAARRLRANVWEVRVPDTEEVARRLRVRDLPAALDDAGVVLDGQEADQVLVTGEAEGCVLVTVVLP